jgi:peptidoglycan/xylan/chitin deacetylase (PgdA/CDA1 family)
VTLFVMGNYIGGDNGFDTGMPLELYCSHLQILELVRDYGCKLGWHTWSHPDLTKLGDEEVRRELRQPGSAGERPWSSTPKMTTVAYPYGRFDDRVKLIAQELGYEDAYSVTQGDGSRFAKVRTYLNK